MAYNKIEVLRLNCCNPALYDVKLEDGNDLYCAINDPIERFLLYRASVAKRAAHYPENDYFIEEDCRLFQLGSKMDCDSCALMQSVYSKLWCEAVEAKDESGIDGKHGDTMTSFQTMLNYIVKSIETQKEKKEREKLVEPTQDVSIIYCLHLMYKSDLVNRLNEVSYLTEFANMVHTLGNFLPVPEDFNKGRCKNDYWDMTLVKIRGWYLANNEEKRREVLHELLRDNAVKNCEKWLKWCGKEYGQKGWNNFVKVNFMEDFVHHDSASNNYLEPIPFFEGHTWGNGISSVEDACAVFHNCSKLISARGIRLVNELKKRGIR